MYLKHDIRCRCQLDSSARDQVPKYQRNFYPCHKKQKLIVINFKVQESIIYFLMMYDIKFVWLKLSLDEKTSGNLNVRDIHYINCNAWWTMCYKAFGINILSDIFSTHQYDAHDI